MAKVYPSMSTRGWIKDPQLIADAVISNFFVSRQALTESYKNNVLTLPSIIQKFGNSETDIVRELTTGLTTVLSHYFGNVEPDVTVFYPNPDDDIRMGLRVYVTYTDEAGNGRNLARELELVNGKVVTIMEINNG